MPTFVSAGSMSRAATCSIRERPLEGVEVVEGHDASGRRGIHLRPEVAAPRFHAPVRPEPGERLVHRAVVVVVVNGDERPVRDHPGESEREAIGVGRGDRELPVRQAEPSGQLLSGPDRVLRRQHRGDPAPELAFDGGDRRRRAVAGHRAGVAEAEVDVVVAVDVVEVGARGVLHVEREGARPLHHPVHRDAGEERTPGALVKRPGARVTVDEVGPLAGHQSGEAGAVEDGHGDHRCGELSAQMIADGPRRAAPVPSLGPVPSGPIGTRRQCPS